MRDVVAKFSPFSLQLGATAVFPDNPGVLYLGVAPSSSLEDLRTALLREIPAAGARDHRPFVPHVTLISRREAFAVDEVVRELAQYRRDVRIEAVSLMSQADDEQDRPWRVVVSYDLGATRVAGRGGLEISLYAGRGHGDAIASTLESWALSNGAPVGDEPDSFFATAEVEANRVGVAQWNISRATVEIASFMVAPDYRGVGIGTRLLDFVEDQARRKGARLVVVYVEPQGDLGRYLVGRGYQQMGELAVFGDARRGFGRAL